MNEEKYILWVTTKTNEGYSSRWHGWSRNLIFTYDEAIKEKERLQPQFYSIEILPV
ncbi:hypothetical protein D3C80_1802780 [compost metagenome]